MMFSKLRLSTMVVSIQNTRDVVVVSTSRSELGVGDLLRPSAASSAASRVFGMLARYDRLLSTRPLVTKVTTATAISVCTDIGLQRFTSRQPHTHDVHRTVRQATWSGIWRRGAVVISVTPPPSLEERELLARREL